MVHGGKTDIVKHINSDRHKRAVISAALSKVIAGFFNQSNLGKAEEQLAEETLVYHIVNHNQSFWSMDCRPTIIQKFRNYLTKNFHVKEQTQKYTREAFCSLCNGAAEAGATKYKF